ncbi:MULTISPECIES: winged helix-turn-helix transcriptional regulator [Elizabethkingia]|uniref:HTH-type transcriptional activator hxlR n=2 Tax=Elizabethkingia anophelis TaxID=1117645 RepID=X5KWH3_9FLAO|nr:MULTISPECIES: helix-turn-helix domain-containing protein [Elizabethkingia]AQW89780.1 MarR family transcriptional regulator [Elizabethkingia anophelis]AQW98485.1 MarR family transcriptional regulator [Elizabethkingia anophelis]AQX50739.1 MarR family transcriptional regulator [Elizabethkingia anophelis]AQX89046.1 MarR family transcriptional regulator [Elizabethkingia anophelis]ASV78341.1 transcriptional regulator [Elizabethkingia anophelis]
MPEFFHDKRLYYTPIEFALNHIGGTWKMPILWRLQEKALRFSELKKDIPHIADKMLTSQLRELESKGMINREVFPVVPPKVEYSLTSKGKKAIPVIETIMKYGYDLIKETGIEYPPKNTDSK